MWVLAAALNAAGLIVLAGMAGGERGTAAAVFPPWWTPAEAFAAAGSAGALVSPGRVPWIVIVRSDVAGLSRRLRAAGAILILPPSGRGLCSTDRSKEPIR